MTSKDGWGYWLTALLCAGILAGLSALVWWSATHKPVESTSELYCTDHDGGEICTKARPQDRLSTLVAARRPGAR